MDYEVFADKPREKREIQINCPNCNSIVTLDVDDAVKYIPKFLWECACGTVLDENGEDYTDAYYGTNPLDLIPFGNGLGNVETLKKYGIEIKEKIGGIENDK